MYKPPSPHLMTILEHYGNFIKKKKKISLCCNFFSLDPFLVKAPTPSSEPCSGYNVLDDNWRDLRTNFYQSYYNDDRYVEWNGWYRLYLNGQSAQLSEWCASFTGCGGEVGLYLNGSHPQLEDGVVIREVLGSSNLWWNSNQCGYFRSTSIQVKACPGEYYVYKLDKPDVSIPRPTYCAGTCVLLRIDYCS